MRFELTLQDLSTIGKIELHISLCQDASDRFHARVIKLVKKINSQIPEGRPLEATRRIRSQS